MSIPAVAAATTAATEASGDAVLLAVFENADPEALRGIDAALDGAVTEMRESREWRGRFAERTSIRTLGRLPARRVALVGLGRPEQLDPYRLYNALHLAARGLCRSGVRSVSVHLDPGIGSALANGAGAVAGPALARAAATALLLGNWDGGMHKTERDDEVLDPGLERVEIVGAGTGAEVDAALAEAAVLAEATNRTRTWVATPSNRLTPTLLASEVKRLYEGTGLEVDVLERADLERLGMGALLGVARGSAEPPVMVCVRWDGGRPDGPRLGLVGKGITFDAGGISIKPAGGMDLMKMDMGGGAAVLGAMWAIARLGIRANVVGVVPATENMPGGHAYKPGDVLRSYSGKTIEVLNTDAEGRIILADGLARAREMGATHLVDCATLTGAVVVALGHATSAMMSNDASLSAMVADASRGAGDRVTELPLHPEYDVALESETADVKNIGGRQAGSITAAVFLREFVGDLPWVHLDIAGTAWNDQRDLRVVPTGPSGTPVRTFVELARIFETL